MKLITRNVFNDIDIQNPNITEDRVKHIQSFWDMNINGEIFIKSRSEIKRGSIEYFESIRYLQKHKYGYWYEEVYDFLKANGSKKFLDVGCGIGCDIVEMAIKGFEVHGLDLSPESIKLAQRHFAHYGVEANVDGRASILIGDAENLPYEDKSFDCVHCGILQHTREPQKGIKELFRVLKPGGRAFILIYHRHSLNYFVHWILGKGFENVADPDGQGTWAWHFTRRELANMIRPYADVRIKVDYLFGAGWGKIYDIFPKPLYLSLGKLFGWFVMAYCIKR